MLSRRFSGNRRGTLGSTIEHPNPLTLASRTQVYWRIASTAQSAIEELRFHAEAIIAGTRGPTDFVDVATDRFFVSSLACHCYLAEWAT